MATKAETENIQTALDALNGLREVNRMSAEDQEAIATAIQALTPDDDA